MIVETDWNGIQLRASCDGETFGEIGMTVVDREALWEFCEENGYVEQYSVDNIEPLLAMIDEKHVEEIREALSEAYRDE